MGIKEGQYKSFSMLIERVIEVAIKEINEKTDLVIGYEVERFGRRPQTIGFRMQPQKTGILLSPDKKEIASKLEKF